MSKRYDSYLAIHKALRLFMCDTLTRIGRTDPADDAEVQTTLKQVGELLDLCTLHIKDENDFIHPALERARQGSAARIQGEHDHHHESIAHLREMAEQTGAASADARHPALDRLYRAMALFVADNFEHMHVEETEHNAVLWAHYSDDEILAVEHELVASIPPQAMMAALRWFLPGLNAVERTGMLQGMQAGMPPPVFAAVLDIARQTLSAGDFSKLTRALGLDTAPELMAA
jgi:hypothetical protein